jgi:hypothetical protein
MEWQEISGNWLLIPDQPIGIIHFLGGAFIGTVPQLSYRWLLEDLGKAGYAVITTPFLNTLDHTAIARDVLNRFENLTTRLHYQLGTGYLPIYGIGHSLGCKLHLLIGSLFSVERAGNILISYNNFPIRRSIPLIEQLEIDKTFQVEFIPTPDQTNQLISQEYGIRRNLLIKFHNDTLDQTKILIPVLKTRFPEMISLLNLSGNHLTPLGQDLNLKMGDVLSMINLGDLKDVFAPFDAVGQWVKQELSKDLQKLNNEIIRWLNPKFDYILPDK